VVNGEAHLSVFFSLLAQ